MPYKQISLPQPQGQGKCLILTKCKINWTESVRVSGNIRAI